MVKFKNLIVNVRKSLLKKTSRVRLRSMLIAFFIFIIVVPITVVVNISLKYSKQIIQHETSVLVANTISQVSTSIDEMLQGSVISVSNFLLHDERIHDILTKKYNYENADYSKDVMVDELTLSNKILFQYTATYDYIKIAALYGRNGHIYNITFPRQTEEVLRQELERIQQRIKPVNKTIQFLSLQKNVFNAQPSSNTREDNVVLAVSRIFDYSTMQYKGLCIFTIFEQAIYEKYMNNKIGKTGKIFIIDENGSLISHMDENALKAKTINSVWIENAFANKNKSFTFTERGKTYLGFTHTSGLTGWITVGIVPLNELTEEMNELSFLAYAIMVIAILITFAAAVVISITITNPINKVIESMGKFQEGDFNTRIDLIGGYEVSKLAEYFNIMVEKIKELILKEYELERKKKEAELYVLQAQINPHFLYNTLESIVWKAKIIGADEICYMTTALGKLFRLAVNKGGPIVRVKEEIEHVKAYMEIQNFRYNGKIGLVINVDDEEILEYKTLKLILQPVVENAIYHGFESLKGHGTICIEVYKSNNNLVFDITDNGVGIAQEALNSINRKLNESFVDSGQAKGGIGLINIHQRIEMYFGKGYGIQIKNNEEKGTTVTIITPLLKD